MTKVWGPWMPKKEQGQYPWLNKNGLENIYYKIWILRNMFERKFGKIKNAVGTWAVRRVFFLSSSPPFTVSIA